ncbi:MAG: hypothetical protein JO048_10115 [Methylobacteriaceae bacterium]|nr:hypothetical protein [Methylobacteriaceae bacterium]
MSVSALSRPVAVTAARLARRDRLDPVLFGLATFATLVVISDALLQDPDTLWHVAVGGRIWRCLCVPWTDTYSHTFAGEPWIAKEWLSQLLLFGAHAVAGWRGVTLLTAATLAGTYALLFGALRQHLRTTLALAVTLVAVMVSAGHFLARPHVFALLTLLLWTCGLVAAAERGREPPARLLLVLILWANLHGSFTIAFPLAGLFALEAWLAAGRGRRREVTVRWGAFLAAALAASCITPYGLNATLVTVTLFGSGETMPFVTEWQPLKLDMIGIVAVGSAAAVAAALAARPRRNAARLLAVALFTTMMLRHGRFLDMFAIAVPLVAAAPIARLRPAWSRVAELAPVPGAGASLRLAGGAVALATLLAALVILPRPEPSRSVTPVAALAAARSLGATGPVYNDYDFGGFLMAEGVPTFIDGRTDQLFLGGFISGLYRDLRRQDNGPFLARLDRFGVGWALVRPQSLEARHLAGAAGWRRAYVDDTATVYLRL